MEVIWNSETKSKWASENSHRYILDFSEDYDLSHSRAWLVRESCFCGKSRITAQKTFLERGTHFENTNESERAVTTGIKELDSTGSVEDLLESGDLTELITTIFDNNDPKKLLELNTQDIDLDNASPPVSVRELPFTGKGLEFIAESIGDYISFMRGLHRFIPDQEISIEERKIQDDDRRKYEANLRVIKHRLGNKLIEIGNFLEWWPDLGPIMRDHFVRKTRGEDGTEKFELSLPFQTFGEGLKNAFDSEFEHGDDTGEHIWEE
jgi:hypothetical protein